MTHQDEAAATDRLRQALAAFQTAQNHLLSAERRLKGLPQAEVDAFWNGLGRRLEANMRTTATEVVAAFKQFSAAGFVASAGDRHLVTQAQRHLSAGRDAAHCATLYSAPTMPENAVVLSPVEGRLLAMLASLRVAPVPARRAPRLHWLPRPTGRSRAQPQSSTFRCMRRCVCGSPRRVPGGGRRNPAEEAPARPR
jgi:hypothetical protein